MAEPGPQVRLTWTIFAFTGRNAPVPVSNSQRSLPSFPPALSVWSRKRLPDGERTNPRIVRRSEVPGTRSFSLATTTERWPLEES